MLRFLAWHKLQLMIVLRLLFQALPSTVLDTPVKEVRRSRIARSNQCSGMKVALVGGDWMSVIVCFIRPRIVREIARIRVGRDWLVGRICDCWRSLFSRVFAPKESNSRLSENRVRARAGGREEGRICSDCSCISKHTRFLRPPTTQRISRKIRSLQVFAPKIAQFNVRQHAIPRSQGSIFARMNATRNTLIRREWPVSAGKHRDCAGSVDASSLLRSRSPLDRALVATYRSCRGDPGEGGSE